MTDNRFPSPGVDAEFPSTGTDARHATQGVDARFPSPGVDARFGGSGYGGDYGNLIHNGDFLSGAMHWTVAAATVTFNTQQMQMSSAGTPASVWQDIDDFYGVGAKYTVTFTIATYTSGSVTPKIGGTAGTPRSAAGTFSETISAGGSDTRLTLDTSNTSNLVIDNVKVDLYALKPIEVDPPVLSGTGVAPTNLTLTDATWNELPAGTSVPSWYRDGVLIAGETGWTYTTKYTDTDHEITGKVTRTNSEGATVSSVSNAIEVTSTNTVAPIIAFEDELVDPTKFLIGPPPDGLNVGEVWELKVADNVTLTPFIIIVNTVDAGEAASDPPALDFVITPDLDGPRWLTMRFNGGPWGNILDHDYTDPNAYTFIYPVAGF
jgi:hypothetical protein